MDTTGILRAFTISNDSSYTNYDVWFQDDPNVYYLEVRFPNNSGDTTGFSQIATSFINSFHFKNENN
jgi:hypothetical protein